uniref:NADH dehydrogenase subunit 3 n=1 Tax=Plaxiphora tricolor TaxID=2045497 RepID=UPI002E76139B|nr:NADH dehydrogenase subunit 3 [Plaxiphora tricolor]WRI60256.1 NADH dehydrogenase subunit 3 [Plaxiphora tricolor]
MILISLAMTFIVFLSGILINLSLFLYKKKMMNREKMSPFECGFDPKNSARTPFSLRFFLITVIFLVFDIEIVLLLPFLITMKISIDIFSLLSSIIVLLILTIGTFHEWSEGSLQWFLTYT